MVDETWEMVQAARGAGPDAGERYSFGRKATAKELVVAVRHDLGVA